MQSVSVVCIVRWTRHNSGTCTQIEVRSASQRGTVICAWSHRRERSQRLTKGRVMLDELSLWLPCRSSFVLVRPFIP